VSQKPTNRIDSLLRLPFSQHWQANRAFDRRDGDDQEQRSHAELESHG
jgi:hypothetical protein